MRGERRSVRIRTAAVGLALLVGGAALPNGVATAAPRRVGTPDAPRDVRAGPRDRAAVVRWHAPADDGGSPITEYVVTVYPDLRRKVVDGDERATRIRDLRNGYAYRFKVQARNRRGLGEGDRTQIVRPEWGEIRSPVRAPVGDTRRGIWYSPPPGEFYPQTMWHFDPVTYTVKAGFQRRYTRIGSLPWQQSANYPFSYWRVDEDTVRLVYSTGAGIAPSAQRVNVVGYNANLDRLTVRWEGVLQWWYGCNSGAMPIHIQVACP